MIPKARSRLCSYFLEPALLKKEQATTPEIEIKSEPKRLYEKWIGVTNQANRLTISRIIEM